MLCSCIYLLWLLPLPSMINTPAMMCITQCHASLPDLHRMRWANPGTGLQSRSPIAIMTYTHPLKMAILISSSECLMSCLIEYCPASCKRSGHEHVNQCMLRKESDTIILERLGRVQDHQGSWIDPGNLHAFNSSTRMRNARTHHSVTFTRSAVHRRCAYLMFTPQTRGVLQIIHWH